MGGTRLIVVDSGEPDVAALEEAAGVLRRGGLVAFATETVYGLGADATQPEAIEKLYAAKGRPATNPLIVHVHEAEAARRWVRSWPAAAERLAAAFWPGPLTLVLPRGPAIVDAVTAGLDTVGVRVPAPAVARRLLAAADRPIAAPSANRSNHVSPTRAAHVVDDLDGAVDLVLDSGATAVGIESTVLDLTSAVPRVLRPGPITTEQIASVLGHAVAAGEPPRPASVAARSPGQGPLHYAPRCPTLGVSRSEPLAQRLQDGDVVLVYGTPIPPLPDGIVHQSFVDPIQAARVLYETLRAWEARQPRRLVIVMPPDDPLWNAVADRLRRATAG